MMRCLCRSLPAFFAGVLLFAGSVPVTPAQEESLKPGINDKYKTADVERTAKMFEGEKRDVVVAGGSEGKPHEALDTIS